MKQIFTIIILAIGSTVFSQIPLLEASEKLIKEKKYETAFNKLNEADPNNDDPDILVAKTDLLLKYFVTSIMHKMFALKDLEAHEDIYEIRGSEGSFAIVVFDPDSLLNRLIKKYPSKYELQKTLGYYFHEIHLKYGTNCALSDEEVMTAFLSNYLTAYDHGLYDYWSTYGIGYAYISTGKYKEAIPFFEKSIELKGDYPSSHYNLAIAYLYNDRREIAIASAKVALELYQESTTKSDAARVIAVIYEELLNNEKALEFYKRANEIDPKNYYTLKPLLALSLKMNSGSHKELTDSFLHLAPTNPTIYQDLMEMYYQLEKEKELAEFLGKKEKEFLKEPKVLANLYFYGAIIQKETNQPEVAKLGFEKARKEFGKVFDSTHDVFKAIDSYTSELSKN